MPDDEFERIEEPEPEPEPQGAAERLAFERQSLENDYLREQLFFSETDRLHRLRLAYGFSIAAALWFMGIFAVVIMHGLYAEGTDPFFKIPTAALVALIGTPGASIVGGVIWLARSVIPAREGSRTPPRA